MSGVTFPLWVAQVPRLTLNQVTGAADKTIRQWDLNTGQCVMTMDILWAMSNSSSSASTTRRQSSARSGRRSYAHQLETIATASIEPGLENYEAFIGGVQFWGYALISGSADGGVRMWDSVCFSLWVRVDGLN